MLALLGPNVAGKTTTMDMLLGLTPRRATAEGPAGAMPQSGDLPASWPPGRSFR
ncbi:hypothetical protein [Spongiactinospora gelatinilytica]|uniref:hypothetical protein n=1 Tax=Spongiactinospora gelatinilytica TaxID=2666298 RepID=UPI0018F54677|nr:hypothetical protein [Spongiactinospora gelatinilytica]